MGVVVNLCLSCVFLEDHGGAFHSHDHAHGSFHDHGHHSHDHGHGASHDEEVGCHHNGHDHGSHEHEDCNEKETLIATGHDHSHSNDSHSHSHSPTSSTGGYGSFTNVNSPTKSPQRDHTTAVTGAVIEEYSPATEPSDVNIQAAYLHVMTDLIQSVGVAGAGLVIWYKPEWQIIDPICTFLFSGLVIWSTFSLLGRVVSILFEGVPAHVDYHAVLEKLSDIPGVVDVHDLHIWSISSTTVALTCHIRASEPQVVLAKAIQVCTSFGIHHSTIQVQADSGDLDLCCQNPSETMCM
jgi:zinc transporter 2